MRIPLPAAWIDRAARRLAGVAEPVMAVAIRPSAVEVRTPARSVVVAPRGRWRIVLLALAPTVFVDGAGGALALRIRVGGLPYTLDALVTSWRRRHGASSSIASHAGVARPAPVDSGVSSWRYGSVAVS